MIYHATHDESRLEPTVGLQMPQQAPPVDRSEATPAAALADNPAIQANGILDILKLPGGFSGINPFSP